MRFYWFAGDSGDSPPCSWAYPRSHSASYLCVVCGTFYILRVVSVATFLGIRLCVYLLALPLPLTFFLLLLLLLSPVSISCFFFVPPFPTFYLFSCSLLPATFELPVRLPPNPTPPLPAPFCICKSLLFASQNFYRFSFCARKGKRYMTGFCLFCVVCQIWNLNFYVSYFLCLFPDSRILFEFPFSHSFLLLIFFIELWQSSVLMAKGLPVGGQVEVARDSPEIVNFCLLLLDFHLVREEGNGNGHGNGYVRLLFKKLQLLPLSESHVTLSSTPQAGPSPTTLTSLLSHQTHMKIIELLCTRWKP